MNRLHEIKNHVARVNIHNSEEEYLLSDMHLYQIVDSGGLNWLINHIEALEAYSEAIRVDNHRLRKRNQELKSEIRTLKKKNWYQVYKENLELIKERDDYKAAFESLRLATPDRK